jgi:hypothetical protein
LAEVNPVRTDGQDQIEVIVNDELNSGCCADGYNIQQHCKPFPNRSLFLAELDHVRTSFASKPGQLGMAELLLKADIRENVETADEHDRRSKVKCTENLDSCAWPLTLLRDSHVLDVLDVSIKIADPYTFTLFEDHAV